MTSDDQRGRRSFSGIAVWVGGALLAAAIVAVGLFAFLGDSNSRSALSATPVVVSGRSANVTVDDNEFEPRNLHIEAGATVTWDFIGSAAHNVRGEDDVFESDTMTDGAFAYTFDAAGEYLYRCTLHPGMVGAIVVREAVTSAP